jgi:glutathione S-transferase
VKSTLIGGAPSESLCVCLGRLESHMTTCGGGFLVQERLSLADVVIWATLYALLAPESTASSGEREGRRRERDE